MSAISMTVKRMNLEETTCIKDCASEIPCVLSVERLDELTLRLSFKDLDDNVYIVRAIAGVLDYPFKYPNLFFEGASPNHKFYRLDADSYLELKKIANTNFGIYYEWYSLCRTMIDIINRIKYSLTVEGEKDMDYCMSSRN